MQEAFLTIKSGFRKKTLPAHAAAFCCMIFVCGGLCADDNNVVRYNRPQLTLHNAGFELGAAEWKPIADNLIGFDIASDSLNATEGRRSLKIDLSRSRDFGSGNFRLVSPWLTLPGGGEFEFTMQIKADAPGRTIAVRVINGVAKQALRKDKQKRTRLAGKEECGTTWTPIIINGTLPTAEKDSYRLALEFEAPGVYWIDQIDFRRNGKSICVAPELEARLTPANLKTKIFAAGAEAPLALWIANRSERGRNLQFHIQQTGRLTAETSTQQIPIKIKPQESLRHPVQLKLPHADDYRLAWSLRDESGKQMSAGVLRVAAQNMALPASTAGEPVWGMHLNATNMDITLPILRQARVTYLRNIFQIYWNQVEPRPGKWQWPDELLAYLHEQDFQLLPILGFPPRWASAPAKPGGTELLNKMPRAMAEYENYLREVITRYGKQIPRWEIWNEPNLPRYFEGTPEEYGLLLAASVDFFKQAQPEAKLAGLSLAWSDDNRELFAKAALSQHKAQPQALSFHPYEKIAPEEALVDKMSQLLALAQQAQGYVPELWATETGYRGRDSINTAVPYYSPARPTTVDEMTQAAFLVRHALLSKSAGVKYYFCYSMDSERPNRGPDIHGLLDYDWNATVKPALLAYLTLAQLCGDAAFEQREEMGDPGLYLLHYRRADGRRFSALWQTAARSGGSAELPASLRGAEAWDFFGNRFTAGNKQPVGTYPIYFLK